MQCDICGKKQATVFLTQVINGKTKKLRLCVACAASSGLEIDESVADILLGAGLEKPASAPDGASDRACPQCRMRYSDFKKTSRLGCPACYEAFENALNPLIESMQRGAQHKGKSPATEPELGLDFGQRAGLKKALEEAVRREKYEEAAKIRDQLRVYDSKDGNASTAC